MIEGWFSDYSPAYNQFIKALLLSDIKAMNTYMNRVALETFKFKVHDPQDEDTLADTAAAALAQIKEKEYETALLAKGISKDRIRKYGFAFEWKKVMIG